MVRRLISLVRSGLAGVAFLGFWAGGLVLVLIVLPLSRWRHRHEGKMARAEHCQRWVQRAFGILHAYMRGCGLLHFEPRRVDASTPGSRFVMVANHPTLVDVVAVSAAFGRIVCVAKTVLFRTPIVGQILRACAYLEGGDTEGLVGGTVVNQALDSLAQAMPVLVFPEGTRSPPGGLRPFKRGAFEIACRANVPLLPVLIRCEPPALGKGRPWYDIPPQTAFFTMTPLPVMNPSAFRGDAGSMTDACEATFRRHLGLSVAEIRRSHG